MKLSWLSKRQTQLLVQPALTLCLLLMRIWFLQPDVSCKL
uniref:Uncharacterized protein n=1 Tax=Rhizophora mucronata TaxID=61149 RepID=A0A2P2PUM2_RHIMU